MPISSNLLTIQQQPGAFGHESLFKTATACAPKQTDPGWHDCAGKFGTMFLAQAAHIPSVHVVGIADLRPANTASNPALVGWQVDRYAASSLDHAATSGTTFISDNWQALVSHPAIDIIVECTGDPVAAVAHAVAAFSEGKHVINATVEADAFVVRRWPPAPVMPG